MSAVLALGTPTHYPVYGARQVAPALLTQPHAYLLFYARVPLQPDDDNGEEELEPLRSDPKKQRQYRSARRAATAELKAKAASAYAADSE